ncbi:hypothetical protein Tco_0380615, partial [Tanacetum coccineum]
MESLHLSFSRVIDAGIFNGIRIDSSFMLSHLFYADDAGYLSTLEKVIFLEWEFHHLVCMKLLHPKAVLNSMEAIRRDFFNGIPDGERKI